MAKNTKRSKPLGKRGQIQEYTGKMIILAIFLVVMILILLLFSGALSKGGAGMQWLT
ncbi:MAG: hypothetical protein AABX47_04035 [Nanoarchaeota archaeon]